MYQRVLTPKCRPPIHATQAEHALLQLDMGTSVLPSPAYRDAGFPGPSAGYASHLQGPQLATTHLQSPHLQPSSHLQPGPHLQPGSQLQAASLQHSPMQHASLQRGLDLPQHLSNSQQQQHARLDNPFHL